MPDLTLDPKRKRLNQLYEEHEAAYDQLGRVLDDVSRVRLEREVAYLEKQISRYQEELGEVSAFETGHRVPEDKVALIRLQLVKQLHADVMEVIGMSVPRGGTPRAQVSLPFSWDELPAILKALDVGEYIPNRFKTEYKQMLEALELLIDARLIPNFHSHVGRKLYEALWTRTIRDEFTIARHEAEVVSCQLCFDPEDILLAQFPWEIIHDNDLPLLPIHRGLELTRSISFADAPTPLQTKLPLRILYICPRPREDQPLGNIEANSLLAAVQPLQQTGQVSIESLAPPTWEALEERLFNATFHIIHFDGHGTFARECLVCGTFHYPGHLICTRCRADMTAVTPRGYLHFEDGSGNRDRVPIEDMKVVLINSQTKLVVLSACASGVVNGTSIFNGVGPGLIQIGVPAVVAMQGTPPVYSAAKFMRRMYQALVKGNRLPEAVNNGRRAIYRDKPPAWFMPVVYLRSSDETNGRLFSL